MAKSNLQNLQSGPTGPGRAKVGHGPLLEANSLCSRDFKSGPPSAGEKEALKERQLLRACLAEAKLAGHREQGLLGLRYKIPKLLSYLQERGLSVEQVGVNEAQEYQSRLIEGGRADGRPYCNSTVLCYLKAAAHFYAFLVRKALVDSNPFREIRRVRPEKKLPRNLPKESQMASLLEELAHYDQEPHLSSKITRYRVHVACELMYASGLRASEVAALRVQDIDLARGLLTVREGKGGRSRMAYLNQYATEVLRLYIERLRPLIHEKAWANNTLLFGCGWLSFGPLVNRTLRRLIAKPKLPPLTCHGFRHALGYHLLRAGCNIRHIQQILGHKNLRHTEVYTKVDREDLREVLDTYHPRRWQRP